MEHTQARSMLLDRQRGRLAAGAERELSEHLVSCAECRAEEAAERALSDAIDRLPQASAPLALKRKLAALVPPEDAAPVLALVPSASAPAKAAASRSVPARRFTPRVLAGAMTAAACLAIATLGVVVVSARGTHLDPALADGAVEDHLAVLRSEHPLSIVSSGIHEVKPWFQGKLDFAPQVGFAGDEDFPLQGGAVSTFRGRPAALLVYKRRAHVISLFVLRAGDLAWPDVERLGPVRSGSATVRGFHEILWKSGDLGYALVSDVDAAELRRF
ncbi:MAG: hypothetical protein JST92_19595, partial [Deltaproteobacteria bacterium]|nr:hypothetical protein [Deltaproteobacteria bacterium]